MIRSAGIALALVALVATGCETHSQTSTRAEYPGDTARRNGGGPPAHAPAHGYRAKQAQGGHIVFDDGYGAYVVVGLPADHPHYGWHYRQMDGDWSARFGTDGEWYPVERRELPPGMAAHDGSDDHPGRGRGKGQARGKSF